MRTDPPGISAPEKSPPQGSWSADVASQNSYCWHLGGDGGGFLCCPHCPCWAHGSHLDPRVSPSVLLHLYFLSHQSLVRTQWVLVSWQRSVQHGSRREMPSKRVKLPGLTTRAQIARHQRGCVCKVWSLQRRLWSFIRH